jgi:hypothetical protein
MRQVKLRDYPRELGEARIGIIRSSISGEAPRLPVVVQDLEDGPDDDVPHITGNPVPQAVPTELSSYAQGKKQRGTASSLFRGKALQSVTNGIFGASATTLARVRIGPPATDRDQPGAVTPALLRKPGGRFARALAWTRGSIRHARGSGRRGAAGDPQLFLRAEYGGTAFLPASRPAPLLRSAR